jgi:hypothetical protein
LQKGRRVSARRRRERSGGCVGRSLERTHRERGVLTAPLRGLIVIGRLAFIPEGISISSLGCWDQGEHTQQKGTHTVSEEQRGATAQQRNRTQLKSRNTQKIPTNTVCTNETSSDGFIHTQARASCHVVCPIAVVGVVDGAVSPLVLWIGGCFSRDPLTSFDDFLGVFFACFSCSLRFFSFSVPFLRRSFCRSTPLSLSLSFVLPQAT